MRLGTHDTPFQDPQVGVSLETDVLTPLQNQIGNKRGIGTWLAFSLASLSWASDTNAVITVPPNCGVMRLARLGERTWVCQIDVYTAAIKVSINSNLLKVRWPDGYRAQDSSIKSEAVTPLTQDPSVLLGPAQRTALAVGLSQQAGAFTACFFTATRDYLQFFPTAGNFAAANTIGLFGQIVMELTHLEDNR